MGPRFVPGSVGILLALVIGAVVGPSGFAQQKGGKKGPPEFTHRKVALPKDEKLAAEVVKEYADEGWEVREKTVDGLTVFRRPYVNADKLGRPKLVEQIQGTWQQVTPEENPPVTLTFKGNMYSTRRGDKPAQVGTIQYLRPSGNLILIDIYIRRDAADVDLGDTARVIARVEGDTLTYCASGSLARRPTAFTSEGGYATSVLKRVKE